jgi:hypothetical protein
MLRRNEDCDVANAEAVFRVLLSQQWNDPGNRRHGVWRTSLGGEKLDENWREFVSVSLIVALEYFPGRLNPDLKGGIKDALFRAAEGASTRDVGAGYTNIALMSAFLLAYVGLHGEQAAFAEQGANKAKAVYELFKQHNTFTEYNSPTYYGVDLLGLALWRELGPTDDFRCMGAEMEADIWRDIGSFYHATLKNMCGPYSRAYGMDMTKYTALTGIWIGLALGSSKGSPLPPELVENRSFEWAYVPMFSILRPMVPKEALRRLQEFDGPRRLNRTVEHGGRQLPVSALLGADWMMGAVTGLERRWEQHYPATIHWLAGDHAIGWLRVHGASGASAKVEGQRLVLTLSDPNSEFPLRLQVEAAGIAPETLQSEVWKLPGLRLQARLPLGKPTVEEVDDKHVGRVLEMRWDVPGDLADDSVVLVLEVAGEGS